ncbi:MAG: glycosyltransferase family 4 protein [Microgenomates group bacterium]
MGKTKNKKIVGFYDPYLDTLGGGERYTLTLANFFKKNGWVVKIFWNNPEIALKIKERFDFNFDKENFSPLVNSFLSRVKKTRKYDLFFWLSDGSIPWLFSKKNILHFQVPFHNVGGKNWLNKLKLKNIDYVVCNSFFTKKFIDREYGINSLVIYPPVAVDQFNLGKKENIILSVGRFSQLLQAKRQDILIKIFKEMVKQGLKNWKLILAGGVEVGGEEYFKFLEKETIGFPIKLIKSPSFEELKKLYSRAKIFWSASGFGIDENKEPEKVEHFGITTIEAMASGVVPIVIKKGEAPVIIKEGENGFLWEKEQDLITITFDLINNPQKLQKLSKKVVKSSKNYSETKFWEKFYEIIKENN